MLIYRVAISQFPAGEAVCRYYVARRFFATPHWSVHLFLSFPERSG
jgi:hypothetical protein